jgi:hypothetical protein
MENNLHIINHPFYPSKSDRFFEILGLRRGDGRELKKSEIFVKAKTVPHSGNGKDHSC